MSSPLEILDQQDAKRAEELKKLAQIPCYDHTQCGEDCLPDCPHYAEKKPEEKAKPAYKYGLEISEPQKRLWVGEVINGSVYKCLYSDTWGGIRMIGTREKTIENAKLIVKALNAFNSSADAPYCHDLEQRIELLEMQLVEAKDKAAAYGRLMSGKARMTMQEMANFIGRPITVGRDGGVTAHGAMPRLETTRIGKFWYNDADDYEEIPESFVEIPDDFDWTTSLTLPDGWEEK